jgi:hypothetical protein
LGTRACKGRGFERIPAKAFKLNLLTSVING